MKDLGGLQDAQWRCPTNIDLTNLDAKAYSATLYLMGFLSRYAEPFALGLLQRVLSLGRSKDETPRADNGSARTMGEGNMTEGIEQFVSLSSADWPEGKQLEVRPGDLSRFAAMGNGIGMPLVLMPWHDPSSLGSRAGYYSYHPRTGHPFGDAPLTDPAGGTLYFDQGIQKEDLQAVLRLLRIPFQNRAYAAFLKHADDPLQERYLTQVRIISKFGLQFMFRALDNDDREEFPEQQLGIGELICRFVEHYQQGPAGTGGRESELQGVMGGDGDFAYERLSFGLMVENDYHGVYRVWTRAWLVTK